VVEAMASVRPVVAVDRGGIPEIIGADVDGLLVPAEDPPAMAEAIVRVLSHPALAERLAHTGRRRVLDTFTPGVQAAAMQTVYEHVVATRRS